MIVFALNEDVLSIYWDFRTHILQYVLLGLWHYVVNTKSGVVLLCRPTSNIRRRFTLISCTSQGRVAQICPWIGFIHGLDWIGSDDCYVQNFDGLCFSAKQTKVSTVSIYSREHWNPEMGTESWICLKMQLHFYFFTVFDFLVFTDGAYCIVVPITSHRHVTLHFWFSDMKDVAH